jgi:hypothetical protein
MPENSSIDDVSADGERIIRVWRENPVFSMSDVTLAQLEAMITDLRTLRAQIVRGGKGACFGSCLHSPVRDAGDDSPAINCRAIITSH